MQEVLLFTLVAEAFADVLLGLARLTLHVLQTKACLVALGCPVAMTIDKVVVGEHVHAVVVPTHETQQCLYYFLVFVVFLKVLLSYGRFRLSTNTFADSFFSLKKDSRTRGHIR